MDGTCPQQGALAATKGRGLRPKHDLVLETIQEHASSLLRVARRYSYCAEDAQDAYQRALEIFIRRADSLDPEGMAGWLRTVVKHEALAVRAARGRQIPGTEIDFDAREARNLPTDDERIDGFALLERSAEALKRLKPQEVRALLLKAQGHTYQEIAELTGWSYTKVNRCLTEGRRSFLDRCDDIESGRECARWAPLLSSVADGEASAKDLSRLRPHLRHCPACRASLGEYRTSPGRVAALVPLGALAQPGDSVHTASSLVSRVYEAITGGLHERAVLSAQKLSSTMEAAASGKVAVVAASAAAIAGGGVAVTGAVGKAERPAKVAAAVERSASAASVALTPASPGATFVTRGAGTSTQPKEPAASKARPQQSGGGEFAPAPSAAPSTRQQAPQPAADAPSGTAKGPSEFEP